MHGTISSFDRPPIDEHPSVRLSVRHALYRWRAFLVVVVIPTLIVAGYLYLVAADQYVSEAHYSVRSNEAERLQGGGVGAVLGLAGGLTRSNEDALNVGDYLGSHDAVEALQKRIGLAALFRRPEADPLSRLGDPSPTPEALLTYYRRQVGIALDSEGGITTIRVRSFRPNDSVLILNTLLELGEQRVNSLNERSYRAALQASIRQLAGAEADVRRSQAALTSFRQSHNNIDPQGTGQAQVQLVSKLRADLAMGRAQLSSMAAAISRSSPQYQAMSARVGSLAAQVAAEDAKLTQGSNSIASGMGGYNELQLRQQFAAKRYESAAAALQAAREQAQRQQLFLVRVVDPNLPVKALYPRRLKIVLTFFGGLLLAYALGWLIVAGMREHAN